MEFLEEEIGGNFIHDIIDADLACGEDLVTAEHVGKEGVKLLYLLFIV